MLLLGVCDGFCWCLRFFPQREAVPGCYFYFLSRQGEAEVGEGCCFCARLEVCVEWHLWLGDWDATVFKGRVKDRWSSTCGMYKNYRRTTLFVKRGRG